MMYEIILNAHVHTKYSDGSKTHKEIAKIAAESGIDGILFNDHNVFPIGPEGYYEFKSKRILAIIGEEIHDIERQPQKNHLLAYGTSKSFSHFAEKPRNLISQIRKNGGMSFIAHPYDPIFPEFDEEDLSWEDWDVSGFTGIELWNNLSEFKIRAKSKLHGYFFAFFPEFMAEKAPKQILRIFDRFINEGHWMVAIAGSDAHEFHYQIGPIIKTVFPYSYHFHGINNHILLKSPLTGKFETDREMVLSSIKRGSLFIANDRIASSKGFRFFAQKGKEEIHSGQRCRFHSQMMLRAELPAPAECTLYKNGEKIESVQVRKRYNYPIKGPGVYRIECFRYFLFKKRGWIYSNPIFID